MQIGHALSQSMSSGTQISQQAGAAGGQIVTNTAKSALGKAKMTFVGIAIVSYINILLIITSNVLNVKAIATMLITPPIICVF